MILRAFLESDRGALEAFLNRHVETSMFPLSNLLGTGLLTEVWVAEEAGDVVGYLGRAENGNLMPQWPDGDWAQAMPLPAGHTVAGVLGPADQCEALMAAVGLDQRLRMMSEVEPGFALRLDDMVLPDCTGHALTVAGTADAPLLTHWRTAYNSEVLGMTAAAAKTQAAADVARMIPRGTHRLLSREGKPLAMAGINARLPVVVQVGAVYTPPALRGQGFSRRVVGLMLARLRGEGISRACLFAASHQAARAYLALGFRRSHSFGLHLFARPEVIACR